MTTLAKNLPRAYQTGEFNELPVIASDIIYEGAAVGENGSGYSRPLVAGDAFQGFAVRQCDNSSGAAGAKKVLVRPEGNIELDVTGVTAVTDEESTVYASDDNTFTLTATSNSAIGKIIRWISSTKCIVYFQATSRRSI